MVMRRAAIYARQSLDRTGQGLAVARQIEDCTALIERQGWKHVATFTDNDVSASNGRVRPEYRRLMEAVEAGRIDTIVSWAPDRLARRPRDLEDLLDLVEGRGVSLTTVSGDVDLSTPYGRTIARIFGAIARQETEQKGARQARANLQRAQTGQGNWTRRPFGYDRVNGEVVAVPREAEALRESAHAILAGRTLASVVRDLNAGGLPTTVGQPFTVTALRRALLNPRLSGQAVHRGVVVGEGAWERILEPDLQNRVSARLSDPARRTQTSTNRRYLLSGLVHCGRCGEPMFASPMGVKGNYYMVYKCRAAHLARRLDLVDNVVEGVVVRRLQQPDAAALLTTNAQGDEELRDQSVHLREQLDELASLLTEGVLTATGVRKASEKLRVELDDVERQRATLGSSDALVALVHAEDVEQAWKAGDLTSRRKVIELLLAVTILPAGKGQRFEAKQVRIDWRA